MRVSCTQGYVRRHVAIAIFAALCQRLLPFGATSRRHGKPGLLVLLAVATAACVAFATADSLWTLIVARAFIGAGASACVMAPPTCYRRPFPLALQLRTSCHSG